MLKAITSLHSQSISLSTVNLHKTWAAQSPKAISSTLSALPSSETVSPPPPMFPVFVGRNLSRRRFDRDLHSSGWRSIANTRLCQPSSSSVLRFTHWVVEKSRNPYPGSRFNTVCATFQPSSTERKLRERERERESFLGC